MVKKSNVMEEESEEKREEKQNIFNTWANSYTEISKTWVDSYEKLYRPWLEATKEMIDKTVLLSKEATPQKYMEFYDEWIKTYQNTFGIFYPIPAPQPNKEILEKFISRADESNKLFSSWIAELEKNSRMTKEILQGEQDPAKYKEYYDVWTKSYEKIFDKILSLPSEESTKELFGEYGGMPDFYLEGFLQMSKLWRRSYTQICGPMNESMMKLSKKMAEISRGKASPESYKEFYTLWVDTYKEIYEKYGKSTELSREMFGNFIKATEIYLSMYKSWITALEEMSEKAQELSKQSDPETYNKFYNLWVKTYEKAFESFFEDMPAVGSMKEIMEPLKIMTRMYTDTFTRMSNMWLKPRVRSAPAYPGKNKKRGIQTA
ncbi:MAG: hypothetical protein MPEBLZ_01589 [Candidatus Methanoperedens nitroreducens]|uniref:Poly(3-hydroxyalkanoate) polymerase subunit PhaE n=1 Tax=Candidatus Methanoperedens nitratireducens TaxID=1392998 RepID=A0A0P8A6X2_9EURY|nr:poly(R)-hydroxyalkanoic acid synthase subunit PhaE [Candidatus Methanoperedens sp. BLZ2]KAB2947959.1 MAG: hypothetical protein F9K14_01495 [Candidatus Methanoperedens sp.]KPQ43872.1 MAG: hypothetical protein MPEBLZ_01589 [Candidatus Methanoperedens sp. BLZ1]MBZ0174076.1 hypothetical protein [Candidatus Methanoperedens nitroreducens]MCX9079072.1 hypothetical protein [Candidatus Methanoperedens sp.]